MKKNKVNQCSISDVDFSKLSQGCDNTPYNYQRLSEVYLDEDNNAYDSLGNYLGKATELPDGKFNISREYNIPLNTGNGFNG